MMTLQEKKTQIFEFLKGKQTANSKPNYKWLKSLNIFCFCSTYRYSKYLSWFVGDGDICQDNHKLNYKYITFSEVQQFIQKTLLQDTYIKVNSPEESKWVQELLNSIKLKQGIFNYSDSWIYITYDSAEYTRWGDYRSGATDSAHEVYQIDIPYLETLFDVKFTKSIRRECDRCTKNCTTTRPSILFPIGSICDSCQDTLRKLQVSDQVKLSDQVKKLEDQLKAKDSQIGILEEQLWAKTRLLEQTERDLKETNRVLENVRGRKECTDRTCESLRKKIEAQDKHIREANRCTTDLKNALKSIQKSIPHVLRKEVSSELPF